MSKEWTLEGLDKVDGLKTIASRYRKGVFQALSLDQMLNEFSSGTGSPELLDVLLNKALEEHMKGAIEAEREKFCMLERQLMRIVGEIKKVGIGSQEIKNSIEKICKIAAYPSLKESQERWGKNYGREHWEKNLGQILLMQLWKFLLEADPEEVHFIEEMWERLYDQSRQNGYYGNKNRANITNSLLLLSKGKERDKNEEEERRVQKNARRASAMIAILRKVYTGVVGENVVGENVVGENVVGEDNFWFYIADAKTFYHVFQWHINRE